MVQASAVTQPVTAQRVSPPATAGEGWERPAEAETAQVGHAASTSYAPAATATARKLNEDMDDLSYTTKPVTPAVTQNYPQREVVAQRPTAPQPQAKRVGGSFIPPKPLDPRQPSGTGADLFGGETLSAPKVDTTEKQQKKSPSLFERFTLQRKEEVVTAPAPVQSRAIEGTNLSVEAGGKQDEDELDIPAFLRRQAN